MLLLGGCRQEEQGRIQNYQPGKYLGRSDTALGQETRDDLRTRIRYQSGAQSGGGGGAPTSTSSSVRPPTASEGVSEGAREAARVRVKQQGAN
jgi:hypothetical protein